MDNPETHVALNTQDKDMDNPETHVALNTQDTGQRHGHITPETQVALKTHTRHRTKTWIIQRHM